MLDREQPVELSLTCHQILAYINGLRARDKEPQNICFLCRHPFLQIPFELRKPVSQFGISVFLSSKRVEPYACMVTLKRSGQYLTYGQGHLRSNVDPNK